MRKEGSGSESERGLKQMKYRLALIGVLITGIALITGCELFSPGESDSDQPAELAGYGGFTTEDESPGFGDTDLMDGYPEDDAFDDEVEDDPQVRNAMRGRGAVQYALRIVWGNLEDRDSTLTGSSDCPVTDWSGSLEIEGGVAIVKRLIRFEPGDYIERTRKSPKEINWVSHTKDHVDGILFKIVDVPDPAKKDSINQLTITTPFDEVEIQLPDLEDYREFVTYDRCNKISIVATKAKPLDCPRGFMEGRWVAESDTSGHFKGAWIGNEGALMGYLRGRYTLREGERVLYGKWITRSGSFQGLLKGTWTPLREIDGPDGIFEGRWVDESFTLKGAFRGHYHIAEDDTAGFFHGRWIKHCK
jgi:hypothetical protein